MEVDPVFGVSIKNSLHVAMCAIVKAGGAEAEVSKQAKACFAPTGFARGARG